MSGPLTIGYASQAVHRSKLSGFAAVVYAIHGKQCGPHSKPDDQPSVGHSDLIAKPHQRTDQNPKNHPRDTPTRDPGADQIISTRDAGAVEIVRSDEILGSTAHASSLSRFVSWLSSNINNAQEHLIGSSISMKCHCHGAPQDFLVRRSMHSSCLRREYTHFAHQPFLPQNKRRAWEPTPL